MPLSEKLICVWDETVRQWTAENLEFAQIKFEFWPESSKNEILRERMKEKSGKSLNLIAEIIIQSRPDADPETVSAFSRLWWAQVDGLVVYFVSHHQPPSEDEMNRIRRIILHLCKYFDD